MYFIFHGRELDNAVFLFRYLNKTVFKNDSYTDLNLIKSAPYGRYFNLLICLETCCPTLSTEYDHPLVS